MASIDLICITNGSVTPTWSWGSVATTTLDIQEMTASIQRVVAASTSEAVLFWDSSLGQVDESQLQELLAGPGDCWHAGLKLGMGGLPGILEFISPGWMLGCDALPDIESTSWRLSLRACLVRMDVLRKLGGIRREFTSLPGATLEMGHRWIRRGVLMRHVPSLLPAAASRGSIAAETLPFVDELRFAYNRHGRKWAGWSLMRAVMTGYVGLAKASAAWRDVMGGTRPAEPSPYRSSAAVVSANISDESAPPSVSILVPTVDRYPYLRTLLEQLRRQTIRPLEIIIVDQTAVSRRDHKMVDDFKDLPLKWIFQDEPGQCTSRNAGLQIARGNHILFIDDDDEVEPDLIAAHLQTLKQYGADVSSGVADEVGAGPLPADFCLLRASDVFPTNNTLIHRSVLEKSGLFDLAYNRRPRADGDLGMRIYLAGANMVLNPAISVLHHHAPSGGLRKHKARKDTYAKSRTEVFCRVLASTSEIYLAGRYFPRTHIREILWQSGLGTFSVRGPFIKRMTKIIVSGCVLPLTIWELRNRLIGARDIAKTFPSIEKLS